MSISTMPQKLSRSLRLDDTNTLLGSRQRTASWCPCTSLRAEASCTKYSHTKSSGNGAKINEYDIYTYIMHYTIYIYIYIYNALYNI